jgi:hypothetical protein
MRLDWLLIPVLTLHVSCKLRSNQASTLKILQGTPSSHNFVLHYKTPSGQCSSVVIGYNLLLTSAHCLQGLNAPSLIVFPELPDLKAIDIGHVFVHAIPKSQSTDEDVAVIVVDRHLDGRTIVPLWDHTLSLDPNDKYVIVGYGNTKLTGKVDAEGISEGEGAGSQHEGSIHGIIEKAANGEYVHKGWYTSVKGIHQGDSGGGLFAVRGVVDGKALFSLIGVTSRGSWKQREDRKDHEIKSVFTKVDNDIFFKKFHRSAQAETQKFCGSRRHCGIVGPSDLELIDAFRVANFKNPQKCVDAWKKTSPYLKGEEGHQILSNAILNYLYFSKQHSIVSVRDNHEIKFSVHPEKPNRLVISWREYYVEDPKLNQILLERMRKDDPHFAPPSGSFTLDFLDDGNKLEFVKKKFLPVLE